MTRHEERGWPADGGPHRFWSRRYLKTVTAHPALMWYPGSVPFVCSTMTENADALAVGDTVVIYCPYGIPLDGKRCMPCATFATVTAKYPCQNPKFTMVHTEAVGAHLD